MTYDFDLKSYDASLMLGSHMLSWRVICRDTKGTCRGLNMPL